jgi:NAD(P)-dependent dehydrogenase (short-subunit alcohol dehydrogenase family)
MDGEGGPHRRCLVTGAAGSIGAAISRRLCAQGHDVLLVDRQPSVHDLAAELNARAYQVDLVDRGACETMVDALRGEPVDILVNNAARVATIGHAHELSMQEWQDDLDLNLTVPFRLIAGLVEGMAQRGWGRIVNIGSIAAGGLYRQSSYAASKAGLVGLTRAVALEYGEFGVTANVVSPGLIGSTAVLGMPEEITSAAMALIPARRLGDVEEIAGAVLYLTGEDGGYVNGITLPVDGAASCNQMSMVRRWEGGTRR